MDPKRENLLKLKDKHLEQSPKLVDFVKMVKEQEVRIQAVRSANVGQDVVLVSYR